MARTWHKTHYPQVIDPVGDRATMCTACPTCRCCEPEVAATECPGNADRKRGVATPAWIQDLAGEPPATTAWDTFRAFLRGLRRGFLIGLGFKA